jgi:aryl-alcohol dehydrogenase-like predicted oxidoreductase
VFLQGLLLAAPHTIDPRFGRLRDTIGQVQDAWRAAGLTPLQGALAAAFSQPQLSYVLVGVASSAQFLEVIAAQQTASQAAGNFAIETWAVDDETILNPANWDRLLR